MVRLNITNHNVHFEKNGNLSFLVDNRAAGCGEADRTVLVVPKSILTKFYVSILASFCFSRSCYNIFFQGWGSSTRQCLIRVANIGHNPPTPLELLGWISPFLNYNIAIVKFFKFIPVLCCENSFKKQILAVHTAHLIHVAVSYCPSHLTPTTSHLPSGHSITWPSPPTASPFSLAVYMKHYFKLLFSTSSSRSHTLFRGVSKNKDTYMSRITK